MSIGAFQSVVRPAGADFRNVGEITNVANAGNDWTAVLLDVTGTGGSEITRRTASTTSRTQSLTLEHETSGDMADGQGISLSFALKDSSTTRNVLGEVIYERAGADNTGLIIITVNNAGTPINALTLSAAGLATFTGYVVLDITDVDGSVEGSLWYDASEDKLKFKTAAGVETITSA